MHGTSHWLRFINATIDLRVHTAVMLARFEVFQSYARLCEERSHKASDVRSMMEWGEAAVQWRRMADTAVEEDRDEAAAS